MKKLRKKIFLTICIIIISIFFCNTSFAAVNSMLREKVQLKTVEEDGEPERYDVTIDGSRLLKTVKIPQISNTLEKILYGHNDLMDIKLLSGTTENKDVFWLNIRNLTQTVFKACNYIAAAAMLSLLLYVAVIMIQSSIKIEDTSETPNRKRFRGRLLRKTVINNLKDKLYIQEWIIGIISLALLPLVINLTIYLSDYIIYDSPFGFEKYAEGEGEGDIVVYVKGGQFPTGPLSISGNESDSNTFPYNIIIGDSRVVDMMDALNANLVSDKIVYDNGSPYHMYTKQLESDIFIGCSGRGYAWFKKDAIPEAETIMSNISTNGLNVIIWLGTNDPWEGTENEYTNTINQLTTNWGTKGVTVTYANIGPGRSDYNVGLTNFTRFNQHLKENLSSNVKYMDDYTFIQKLIDESGEDAVLVDDLHYNNDVSKKVYNFFKGVNSNELITTENAVVLGGEIKDFYFTTNTEGLIEILTYHDGLKMGASIASFLVLVCKGLLLVLFLMRVYLLGIVIAISPILVVVNVFKKINRENGFLQKWVKLFLYLVFIRMIIFLFYYIYTKVRPQNANAELVFISLFSVAIIVFCIATVVKAIMGIFKKGRGKRA